MPGNDSLYGYMLSVETGLYGYNQFSLFEGKTSFDILMKWHTHIKFPHYHQWLYRIVSKDTCYLLETGLYGYNQFSLFERNTGFDFLLSNITI